MKIDKKIEILGLKMNGITHIGVIRKKDNNKIEIKLIDKTSCSSCSLKGACSVSEEGDNDLEISIDGNKFDIGEKVKVHLSNEMAFAALFWAYLFPFIILLIGVIVLSFYFNDGITGLISLLFLFIYYLVIFFNKGFFNSKFQLKIKRL